MVQLMTIGIPQLSSSSDSYFVQFISSPSVLENRMINALVVALRHENDRLTAYIDREKPNVSFTDGTLCLRTLYHCIDITVEDSAISIWHQWVAGGERVQILQKTSVAELVFGQDPPDGKHAFTLYDNAHSLVFALEHAKICDQWNHDMFVTDDHVSMHPEHAGPCMLRAMLEIQFDDRDNESLNNDNWWDDMNLCYAVEHYDAVETVLQNAFVFWETQIKSPE